MAVREIDIASHWDAALPLMEANWRETGASFDFAPSLEFFAQAQALGMLLALGAFHDDKLVGYASGIVAPHPFNPAIKVASVNVLYVKPEFRCGVLPGRLRLVMRQLARERSARTLYWQTRGGTPLAKMLEERGCEVADVVMSEEL